MHTMPTSGLKEHATAAASEVARNDRRRWKTAATLAVGLLLLLAGNYVLRAHLEESRKFVRDYFSLSYAETLDAVYAKPWYQFLLPIKEWTGSWTSTSLLLLPPLTRFAGSYSQLYVILNLMFVVVAFVTSWIALRSPVFTLTLTACAAFTTYNYHVYSVTGSVNQYFIVSYLLCLLLCQYKLFDNRPRLRLWWPLWGLALSFYVLSYEGWLSYVVFVWLLSPVLGVAWYRAGDRTRFVRLATMVGVVTLTAAVYVGVKWLSGWGQGMGSESDVVFNYRHRVLAVEDVISNFFSIFYTIITNYLPPCFVSSNSLRRYGGAELIACQGGYDQAQSYLVPLNHLFLWRYYAGIAATIFLLALARLIKQSWKAPSRDRILLCAFMLMILTGSPTHLMVKWRPMHAVPYLSYHFYFGVIGLSLLIAYLAHLAHQRIRRRALAWCCVGVIWADIVVCAFSRPPFLSHLASQVGMGTYPNPWKKLLDLLF